MKYHAIVTLFLAALVATPVLGQIRASDAPAAKAPAFIDVDFTGGTVDEYLLHLRKLDPEVRIICSAAAKRVPVPSIQIKKVPVRVAMNALVTVSRNASYHLFIDEESFTDPNSDEGILFAIDVEQRHAESESLARVVSAKHALNAIGGDNPAAALQETIQTGLDTVFEQVLEETVVVRLHESSGLLFIRGPMERVDFVLEIVDQLSQNGPGPGK